MVGAVAEDRAEPGVGVLHVVDRVVAGLLGPDVEVEVDRRVAGVPDQGVPCGVGTQRLDQVVDEDHGPGALGHPHRLPVADEVDHLADQHLEVLVRGVAEGLAHRHQPADVPVVVGAEHDHAQVEAALALVEVVGAVTRDVGRVRRRT